MKNIRWNVWTVLLAIIIIVFGIRILASVFSWLWVLGSFVFNILVWVAAVLLLVYVIRLLYNKLRNH